MVIKNNKSGFALVTVLVLLIGLSLAGAGLTFKLVYEARLVDTWQQREVANTTSETGIESAKRWLESELDKGSVLSEGNVLKANDGSPNYCLKGFKEDEITSLKTETALLSTELNDESFKNYSYEYYIEDITKEYNNKIGIKEPKTYIYIMYSDDNFHDNGDQGNYMLVLDALTGENSDKHPVITDRKSKSYGKTGYALYGPTWQFRISGDLLYIHHGESIWGLDKFTGAPKIEIDIKDESRNDVGYFFLDDKYLYYRIHDDAVHVYDKITGLKSQDHPEIIFNNNGISHKLSGYIMPNSATSTAPYFFIDGNFLYDFNNYNGIIVYNKIDGSLSLDHQKHYNQSEEPLNIGGLSKFIEGDYIYFYNYNDNGNIIVPVMNKITALPSIDKYEKLSKFSNRTVFKNLYGLQTGVYGGSIPIYVHKKYLYKLSDNKQVAYYDKFGKLGKIGEYNLEGFNGLNFREWNSQIVVEGGSDDNLVKNNYFRIRSCGFGLNKSVNRIESIYSYSSDTKNLKQVSWKELF